MNHHGAFIIFFVLGLLALAFLIYLAVRMSKAKTNRVNAKKNMKLYIGLAIALGLVLIVMTIRHYQIRIKISS